MKILFVTGNKGKLEEARSILEGFEVDALNADIPEIKSLDQHQVVIEKAKKAFEVAKKPLFVEDTALYLKSFKDFPGTYTAFAYETIGLEGILKLIEGMNKQAHFLALVAFVDEEGKTTVLEGRCDGLISKEIIPPVDETLPYDSVFIPLEGDGRTFSQMTKKEKDALSHRGRVLRKLREWL
ncbi:non-canonical purine NTP pyrophosphatase [Candidatus Micrarchaeota archaeon]|nr:non-canonical purine NTP pyrophosphatase [Candidatus Micrarchaeota archaeon]